METKLGGGQMLRQCLLFYFVLNLVNSVVALDIFIEASSRPTLRNKLIIACTTIITRLAVMAYFLPGHTMLKTTFFVYAMRALYILHS